MMLKLGAEPSALPEITELSLSLMLLLAIGLFLGSFAVRHADLAIGDFLGHRTAAASA